jgi:hypothetical protein
VVATPHGFLIPRRWKLAKDVFDSASIILTTIRVRFLSVHVGRLLTDAQDSTIKEADCVELGLTCAEVCQALGLAGDKWKATRPAQLIGPRGD